MHMYTGSLLLFLTVVFDYNYIISNDFHCMYIIIYEYRHSSHVLLDRI